MLNSTYSVRYRHPFLYGWKLQIILHIIPATAIGLVIGGALTATDLNATSSDKQTGNDLVIVGVIIFFVLWLILCWLDLRLYWTPSKSPLEKKVCCRVLLGLHTIVLTALTSS